MIDVALVGYLVYLRGQVRMEEAIRDRRAARMAGTRHRPVDDGLDDQLDRSETAPDARPEADPDRR